MITRLIRVTIVAPDQEEALKFYTETLGFEKRADFSTPGFRWLTVAPCQQEEVEIVLQQPFDEEMRQKVGQNPTWVLATDDCRKTHAALAAKGVRFVKEPTQEPYGLEAVFLDLYGNPYSLLQS